MEDPYQKIKFFGNFFFNQRDVPSWNEGFRVSAGIETFIGTSKTKDSNLAYPYNDYYSLENLEDYKTFKFLNKYIHN